MKKAGLFLLALCLVLPAAAAEEKGEGGPQGGKPGTNVPMDFLMVPLTGASGKLIGYAYITSRLTAASEAFVVPVRDKLPFIQDAFVRDVNAKGVAAADDPLAVDIPALETRLMADAVRVMGPGKVKMITVCTVNIAELHPVQTPSPEPADAHRDVDAHRNPLKSRCEPGKSA
jgi:hypothetical protein